MILISVATPEIPESIQHQLVIVQNPACQHFGRIDVFQIYNYHHYPFHSKILFLFHREGFVFIQGLMDVMCTLWKYRRVPEWKQYYN